MECRSCCEALTAYLDQELSPGDRHSVEEHLDRCTTCRDEYESLLEAYTLTAQLPSIVPGTEVWAGIRSQLVPISPVPVPGAHRSLAETLFGWLMRPWVPISALGSILTLMLVVNYLDPPTNPVENEFSHFIQQRERIYENQRKLLSTQAQWQLRDERNPFSQPVSFSDKNPFQE